MRPKRPILLYLLVFYFLSCTFISIIGIIGTLQSWNWLVNFSEESTPILAIFTGVFFTLAWLTSAISLWSRLSWSVTLSVIISLLSTAWFWVDRIFLTNNPLPIHRHLFPLLVTLFLLVVIMFSLYLITPYIKISQFQDPLDSDFFIQTKGKENGKTPA